MAMPHTQSFTNAHHPRFEREKEIREALGIRKSDFALWIIRFGRSDMLQFCNIRIRCLPTPWTALVHSLVIGFLISQWQLSKSSSYRPFEVFRILLYYQHTNGFKSLHRGNLQPWIWSFFNHIGTCLKCTLAYPRYQFGVVPFDRAGYVSQQNHM